MVYLRLFALTGLGLFLMGCASPTTEKASFDSPLGKWQTKIQIEGGTWISHGVMTFPDSGQVSYALRNGRILFDENNGGKWKGRWVEDNQVYVRCSEKVDGSHSWGEAIFQFDAEFKTFRGSWDKCGDGDRNAWVGYRL